MLQKKCFRRNVEKRVLTCVRPRLSSKLTPSTLRQGSMVSPNSVPTNLDGNKAVERRPSKAGVSRESSSVDFSKVTQSKRRAQKLSIMVEGLMASSLSFPSASGLAPEPASGSGLKAAHAKAAISLPHEALLSEASSAFSSLWIDCRVAGQQRRISPLRNRLAL